MVVVFFYYSKHSKDLNPDLVTLNENHSNRLQLSLLDNAVSRLWELYGAVASTSPKGPYTYLVGCTLGLILV